MVFPEFSMLSFGLSMTGVGLIQYGVVGIINSPSATGGYVMLGAGLCVIMGAVACLFGLGFNP